MWKIRCCGPWQIKLSIKLYFFRLALIFRNVGTKKCNRASQPWHMRVCFQSKMSPSVSDTDICPAEIATIFISETKLDMKRRKLVRRRVNTRWKLHTNRNKKNDGDPDNDASLSVNTTFFFYLKHPWQTSPVSSDWESAFQCRRHGFNP